MGVETVIYKLELNVPNYIHIIKVYTRTYRFGKSEENVGKNK